MCTSTYIQIWRAHFVILYLLYMNPKHLTQCQRNSFLSNTNDETEEYRGNNNKNQKKMNVLFFYGVSFSIE